MNDPSRAVETHTPGVRRDPAGILPAGQIRAPFTDDQVASINAYQRSDTPRPYSCRARPGPRHGLLIATADRFGCPDCDYTRQGCYVWLGDWAWRNATSTEISLSARPYRCDCAKLRYQDEAVARAAAGSSPDVYGPDFRVYKCSGYRCWHIATRGFHPRNLRTLGRILAYHLYTTSMVEMDSLLRELAITPDSNRHDRVRKTFAAFEAAGLARRRYPSGPYTTATDRPGLLRVIEVGWEQFQYERAIEPTERARAWSQPR